MVRYHDLFSFPSRANLSENPHQKAAVVRLAGHRLTNGLSKVCWQILRCREPYWSQKFACFPDSLCGQEEAVSHGPTTPATHLFSSQREWRRSLCGIVKPRKTLKIPLNFYTLLAVEMYNLLRGGKKPPAIFFPHCFYFRGYLRDQVMILRCLLILHVLLPSPHSLLPRTMHSSPNSNYRSCPGIVKRPSFCDVMLSCYGH